MFNNPGVAAEVACLDRSSSAERAADILRRSITEGALPPGAVHQYLLELVPRALIPEFR